MKRLVRNLRLTPEEAGKYKTIRGERAYPTLETLVWHAEAVRKRLVMSLGDALRRQP
jgi:hypothetical protein